MLFDNRYEYDSLTDKLGEGGKGISIRCFAESRRNRIGE